MGPLGVREHARVESADVVRTQDRGFDVGKREVDQRLVTGRLDHLRLAAVRPDRLADEPAARLAVDVSPVPDLGDDPARVAPELAHVEEPDPIRGVAERLSQRLDLLARNRHHQRLAGGIAGAQELAGAGQVLVEVAVEQGDMVQATLVGVCLRPLARHYLQPQPRDAHGVTAFAHPRVATHIKADSSTISARHAGRKKWGVPAGGRARRGCPLGERASTPH
jgi:hypothetical protein